MIYSIIDVETTGGNPKNSKITEIAIYNFDGNEIVDEFITLINPEMEIPDFIVRLTGIKNEMVQDAPKFYEVANKIIEMTENSLFVAHNVGFDYGMIRHEFKSLGYDYRRPHLCTVRASRVIIPGHESYSLGKLSRALDIKIEGRHRAGGDAMATVALFKIIHGKDKNKLSTFIQNEVNTSILHPQLDIDVLDDIPNKAGVYTFYNDANQRIYIGKSKHIKKRIEQHLKNHKTAKGLQMAKEIFRIEYEITGSEVIALLKESKEIKKYQPIFNRQLRKNKFPYGIFDVLNDEGYLELKLSLTSKTTLEPIQLFATKKEAQYKLEQIQEAYNLCQKLCGLYKTKTSCFHFEIKKCQGACLGIESTDDYNQRVEAYIASNVHSNNNFYIVDKGRVKGEKSLILVQNGSYAGYGYAPFHFNQLPPVRWFKFIEPAKEDKDSKWIVKHVQSSLAHLQIIPF